MQESQQGTPKPEASGHCVLQHGQKELLRAQGVLSVPMKGERWILKVASGFFLVQVFLWNPICVTETASKPRVVVATSALRSTCSPVSSFSFILSAHPAEACTTGSPLVPGGCSVDSDEGGGHLLGAGLWETLEQTVFRLQSLGKDSPVDPHPSPETQHFRFLQSWFPPGDDFSYHS